MNGGAWVAMVLTFMRHALYPVVVLTVGIAFLLFYLRCEPITVCCSAGRACLWVVLCAQLSCYRVRCF